ncbi:MAG: hypothetical protein ACR2LJ_08080 [Acidimicrobiales bacterium]
MSLTASQAVAAKSTDPTPVKAPGPASRPDPKLQSFGVDRLDTSDADGKNVTAHQVTEISVMHDDGTRTVTDKTLDPSTGAVTKTKTSSIRGSGLTGGESAPVTTTTTAPGSVTSAASGSGGCCSAEGWRWVRTWTNFYSTLGSLVFTWNVQIQWAWGGGIPGVQWGHVYNQWHPRPWFSNVSGCCYVVQGEPSWETEFFYGWDAMNYSWNTGWSYQAKGQIQNCVFKYGCGYTTYPRINMYAHANGSYYWSTTG